ncbi:FMN-binding protein [Pseudotenacibaculum sp. MALMAid0570]|uniref:FMN-binding protein n=1 Tax=Pseudotenacibaculum sp. MALMAid0570 TaxID=3143938 RepID=UPI0032DE7332
MKNKRFSIFLFLPVLLFLCSFGLPKVIEKKVRKEIGKTFDIKEFSLQPLKVSPEVNKLLPNKIKGEKLFKIENKEKVLGYAFVDKAPSRTDEFDYLILLNKDLIIAKTKVLIYREDYGGEIGSKRWLKQFDGLNSEKEVVYEKDIIPISGATISALSMTKAVNSFLGNLKILIKQKVFE